MDIHALQRVDRSQQERDAVIYASVAMCVTVTAMTIAKGDTMNAIVAVTTAYLVITGLSTVRPPSAGVRFQYCWCSWPCCTGCGESASGEAFAALLASGSPSQRECTPHRTSFF